MEGDQVDQGNDTEKGHGKAHSKYLNHLTRKGSQHRKKTQGCLVSQREENH
jgi:hypothetical protein